MAVFKSESKSERASYVAFKDLEFPVLDRLQECM